MFGTKRLEELEKLGFDEIYMHIKTGKLKCGKYSKLIKFDKDAKPKGNTYFEKEK